MIPIISPYLLRRIQYSSSTRSDQDIIFFINADFGIKLSIFANSSEGSMESGLDHFG